MVILLKFRLSWGSGNDGIISSPRLHLPTLSLETVTDPVPIG